MHLVQKETNIEILIKCSATIVLQITDNPIPHLLIKSVSLLSYYVLIIKANKRGWSPLHIAAS